jgi:peptide chain release factor subunit 1
MEEIAAQKLKLLINELSSIKGKHTELVTVYIPAGFNLLKVVEQLRGEQSTAQNIKSKSVRKNVLSALEKILAHLRLYKETPENGLAIFCGNVSKKEGVADIKIWAIEPPEPLKVRLYRCDQNFILDPIQAMTREKEIYGLIVLDKSDAEIGLLKGKVIESIKHLESIVPGKTKAGGWSQQRYARIREALLNDFLKKVGDIASQQFRSVEIKGIIIGGPGPVKDIFASGDYLAYDLKAKVIGSVNTSYTGQYGLKELVERSEDILAQTAVIREKKILDRFFTEFAKGSDLAIYGLKETIEALKTGNLELLLLSEDFDWVKVETICSCGKRESHITQQAKIEEIRCSVCKGKPEIVNIAKLEEQIVDIAKKMGTTIELISVHTPKGLQLKELGGIAGILRYKA